MGLPPYRPNAIHVGLLPLWHKLRVGGDLKRRVGEPILSFQCVWAAARPPNTANPERTVGLGSVRARHDMCHVQNDPASATAQPVVKFFESLPR